MGDKRGFITVQAVSPIAEIVKRPLRFEPPLIDRAPDPEGFRFWWSQLEAIFEINDPRNFPSLPEVMAGDERAIVDRFIEKAEELATSTALNFDGGIEVSISDDDGSETVTTNLPAPDVVAGFAALFRQFYATDERASFKAVSGILMRRAKEASDERAEERREELRRWGKAQGKLRMFSVERLAHEKLIDEGKFPPIEEVRTGGYPDPENPQQVISTFFYGEHLHWSEDKAAILVERERDAFEDARSKLFFLQASAGLAHLYIGYSVLARSALGLAA